MAFPTSIDAKSITRAWLYKHLFTLPLDTTRSRTYVHVMFHRFKQIWDAAVVQNAQALALVAADILALLHVYGGMDAVALPRSVHATILRVLRPAESALRRLIVIAARDLLVEPLPQQANTEPLESRTSLRQPATRQPATRQPATRMSFQLVDPRKRFNARRVIYTTLTPRISFIAPNAPYSPLFSQPQARLERSSSPLASDRHISARRIALRLRALTVALDDIPRQAKRLVRWRRKRETLQPPRFFLPLRPGNPPGHRARPQHEIDDILAECHKYALGVLSEPGPNASRPNTS